MKTSVVPLAPARARLSPIGTCAAVAGATLLTIGTAAAGNLLSTWVWKRHIEPRRNRKKTVTRILPSGSVCTFELEAIEERVIKRKKLRVVVKNS